MSSEIAVCYYLEFVSHDKKLFRLIHQINKCEEERIKKEKYTNILNKNGISRKIFNDTEEYKNLKAEEIYGYAVEVKDGINLYEGIQERQDACVKFNLLYGGNIWINFNEKKLKIIEQLLENNLITKYGMPISVQQMNKEKLELFNKIVNEGETSE